MSTTEVPKRDIHYWMCDICAAISDKETKYPEGGNTIAVTKCDWCKTENIRCTPIVDFKRRGRG